jgi:molybdopterin-guanine dinucleotide biosynthesis protein A
MGMVRNMMSVNIAILAGGRSSRMGADKSLVHLGGKPVIEHVLERVRPLGLPIILITNSPEKYAAYQLPMIADLLPEQGSLGGIYTAIASSGADYALCVACDMPFLNTALLRYQIARCEGWDVVVPRTKGFPETLHAIYSKACIVPIQNQLSSGQLKVSGFYDQVKTLFLEEDAVREIDPELRSFVNVNTPDELSAAENML